MNALPDESLAAVFAAAGEPLDIRPLPLPELRPGEVLVRVTCCTVCGSDVHTYQGHRTTPVPTVLGHEILGTVAAIGPGEPVLDHEGRPLDIGDRVTWSIAASCGACFFCEHGIPQKCERLFKYGHERIRPEHQLSGGLAEYCHLAPGTAIIPVPEALPDVVACPANCATATVAGALRIGGGCDGAAVLIQGAGMLGLTACAMARSRGAQHVIACDVDTERLELARRFGATRCVAVTDDGGELTAAVNELTGGRGVDLALELSGAIAAMEAGLKLLRIGAHYVLVGAVFPSPPLAVDPEAVIRRLLNIHGLHNYTPADLAAAIEFLTQHHGEYPFAELVADTFPLCEAELAFEHAIRSRALRVAVLP
jgi:alcohol dehydrogenase